MAVSLADLLAAVRRRSPRFTRERIPDKLLAGYLSDAQREVLSQAQQRNPEWGAQTATLALVLAPPNAADVSGPGGTGGLPAGVTRPTTDLSPTAFTGSAGYLAELDVDRSQGDAPPPVALAGPFVPSAVDNTGYTLTVTGAGWATDAFVGALARVLAGPGAGQRRRVVRNTDTTLTFDQAWGTAPADVVAVLPTEAEVPDTTSELDVVQSVLETTGAASVVTALPAMESRVGYLTRLDADGIPRIDLARPVISTVDAPVPLPPLLTLLGGTVRYVGAEADVGEALEILPYGLRFAAVRRPAVRVTGDAVYLVGGADVWGRVASVELHYVPVLGDFTAPTDLCLLPDAARGALTALGAAFCAAHLRELGEPIDVADYAARATTASITLLDTVSMAPRAAVGNVREVW